MTEVLPSSASAPSTATGSTVLAEPVVGRRAKDVTITWWVRLRSTFLLALTVLGIAAIVGAVLSVVVVGIVFVAT